MPHFTKPKDAIDDHELEVAFRNQAVQSKVTENEELEIASVSNCLDATAEET